MSTSPSAPGAGLGLPSVPNLRDLGGWPTGPGTRVARGLAYRSDRLALADSDLPAFADLGIRTVYDLRTAGESAAVPDVLPPRTSRVGLDILADSAMSTPADLLRLFSDPPRATEELHGNRVRQLFDAAYRELIALPSARAGYRALFTGLAVAERRPALFHCTTGKDRTGWAAAALLLLLGVSDEDVMAEYLRTNDLLVPALQPMFDAFDAGGGDHAVLIPVLGVDPEYLGTALAEMAGQYGDIEGYFRVGLDLDAATIDTLREAFTESARD